MIVKTKQYKTRSGLDATIVTTESPFEDFPVIAKVEGKLYEYSGSGKFYGCFLGDQSSMDLIPVTDFLAKYSHLKYNQEVLVSTDVELPWIPAHFAGVNEKGEALVFTHGTSSWTGQEKTAYRYCKTLQEYKDFINGRGV